SSASSSFVLTGFSRRALPPGRRVSEERVRRSQEKSGQVPGLSAVLSPFHAHRAVGAGHHPEGNPRIAQRKVLYPTNDQVVRALEEQAMRAVRHINDTTAIREQEEVFSSIPRAETDQDGDGGSVLDLNPVDSSQIGALVARPLPLRSVPSLGRGVIG